MALSTAADTTWGVGVEGRRVGDVAWQSFTGNLASQLVGDGASSLLRGAGYVSRARLCFAAGTLVEMQEALSGNGVARKAIEQLDLGRRVRGENPLPAASEPVEPDGSWKRIVLAPLDDARNTQIELLRSDAWIAVHGARIGRTIHLEIPELSLSSAARVVSISAGPTIVSGEGRVVTGLFRHTAEQLLELHVEGLAEPIVGTPKHPYWSVTRNNFVAADQLFVGEELRTSDGRTARVARITFRREPTTVYNLEVQGEHVYQVSPLGLLVHNASFASPANAQISSSRGLGGNQLVDRIAGEPQGALEQADRILRSGGANTRWANIYQRYRGAGGFRELIARRNALHQEAERLLLVNNNRYVRDAQRAGVIIEFNRGSRLGATSANGNLLRPDIQIGMPNGRYGIIDWSTVGSAGKIRKYGDAANAPWLINVTLR